MPETEAWYAGRRVAVLGASGFIGRWVARCLTQAGADLVLVVRDAAAARPVWERYGIEGRVHVLDLRDAVALQELWRELRPSVTFNLAGYGVDRSERDEATAYQVNAHLLQTLCRAVAAVPDPSWPGQQIVHAGSALEYGEIGGDLRETSQTQATTLYGKSKLAGTKALAACSHEWGLRSVTARLFTIYGPGEHPGRLLPALLATAVSREPLPLTAGRQRRDFTYVADVAEGLLRLGLAETTAPGEIINLATGHLTSVRQFVEIAAGTLGIPPHLLQFGALTTRREEMEHADVAIQRLRHHLHWFPQTDIAGGVAQTRDF